MKSLWTALLSFCFLSSLVYGATLKQDSVKDLDRKICDAYLEADTKAIDQWIHDDFVIIDASGVLQKGSKQKELKALKEGTLGYTKIDLKNVEEKYLGQTAFLSGIADLEGFTRETKGGPKVPFAMKVVYSETWSKNERGQWVLIGEHMMELK